MNTDGTEFEFDETVDFYNQNQEFNEYLDANGEVDVFSYSYLPSRVLFQVDNRAYLLELNSWKEGLREEKVSQAEEILVIDDNKDRIHDLISRIKNNRTIPFVGAGMSVPSGMPSWEKFLRNCASKCGIADEKINSFLTLGLYEQCADAIIDEMKEEWFLQRFRYEFNCEKEDIDGSIKLLPELFYTGVITTNFDRLIEFTYDGHVNTFKNVFTEIKKDSLDYISRGDNALYKVHGHFESQLGRILTSSEYDLTYGQDIVDLKLMLPRFFKSITRSYCLLFMGCSLKNDRVMKMLKTIKQDFINDGLSTPEHFAFVSEPTCPKEKLEREKFLIDHMIFPIWYPSEQHEYIDYIFNYILEKMN